MNTVEERLKLEAASRERLLCWQQLQPAIVDYAAAVAPTAVVFGSLWQAQKIAGPNHLPRVALNRASCFEKWLPFQMITVKGKKRPFCSQKVYDTFCTAMLAIGVDIKSPYSPIVSVRVVSEAIGLFRLSGQPYPEFESEWRARKVKAQITRNRRRWTRLAEHEAQKTTATTGNELARP